MEPMAINKNEWEQIKLLLKDALSEHDKGKLQRFKSWSPLGALVAVILFMLTQWNAYSVFRTHTEDRLATIEGKLLKAEATQSPQAVLAEISKLPTREFRAALPALRAVAEQPASEVKPSDTTLHDISNKLRDDIEPSSGYWPTALQFIQFASSSLSTKTNSPTEPVSHISNLANLTPRAMTFSNKTIMIDGTITGLRFENCRIIFPNNPVQIHNVAFINCIFEFPDLKQPTPYLIEVGRQLLSGDLERAAVNYG